MHTEIEGTAAEANMAKPWNSVKQLTMPLQSAYFNVLSIKYSTMQ
jgi:hypothetical protein